MAIADCTCEGCGVNFSRKLGTKNSGKYCSRECYTARKVERAKQKVVLAESVIVARSYMRTCIGCGCRFHSGHWAATYCQSSCRPNSAPIEQRLSRSCHLCGLMFVQRTHLGRPEVACEQCRAKWQEARRAEYRKTAAYQAVKRVAKSRRRARIRGLRSDAIDPIRVFERDGWRCHICKKKTLKSKRGTANPRAPELDHIVSLSEGGTHTWGNVACSCKSCNGVKGARSMGQLGLGLSA